MKIITVPCLDDNYSYIIIDEATKEGAVVDPVEPEKVLEVSNDNNVQLKLVLTTHHHWDHAGGNEKIKQLVPGIKVYGGSLDNVKGCTNELKNGNKFSFGVNISVLALHTPCHTKGHISYFVTGQDGENPAVFTGDTLFVGGCGKFFEGTADQMYQSLCVTLSSLPKPTQVYCGHEYTVKNLQFALTVEPENSKIVQKLSWAQQKREAGLPTIPSTIDEELETNPFMRVDLPELQGMQIPNNKVIHPRTLLRNSKIGKRPTLATRIGLVLFAVKILLMVITIFRSRILCGIELSGSLPKEIGKITSLQLLLLSGNLISGPLPDELGFLPNLTKFQLDLNFISGPIPKSFANLTNVKHFHMNNNSISGQIPPELYVLPLLVHFLLDNNNLSGYLPPELAKMPTLKILQLDNNNFDGTEIPVSYGNISTLLKLSLRNCKLTGSVPDISGMRRLNYLDLSQNQLSGNIPPINLF